MNSRIELRKKDGSIQTFDESQIRKLIEDGKLRSATLCRLLPSEEWVPLSKTFPEVFAQQQGKVKPFGIIIGALFIAGGIMEMSGIKKVVYFLFFAETVYDQKEVVFANVLTFFAVWSICSAILFMIWRTLKTSKK